jgi:hypothetical protein
MTTILASSNTAPLNSVIKCYTIVTTALNILSRGKRLHLGPELTDLMSTVRVWVRAQGPWVPLWQDLPLPRDMSEAAVPLSCLGALPRTTRLEW